MAKFLKNFKSLFIEEVEDAPKTKTTSAKKAAAKKAPAKKAAAKKAPAKKKATKASAKETAAAKASDIAASEGIENWFDSPIIAKLIEAGKKSGSLDSEEISVALNRTNESLPEGLAEGNFDDLMKVLETNKIEASV